MNIDRKNNVSNYVMSLVLSSIILMFAGIFISLTTFIPIIKIFSFYSNIIAINNIFIMILTLLTYGIVVILLILILIVIVNILIPKVEFRR